MQTASLSPTLIEWGNCPEAVLRMILRILGQQERIILELFSGLSRLRNGSKLNMFAILK